MLRVTVDTNVLSRDLERMRLACAGLAVEIIPTTVTLREQGMTKLPENVNMVAETGVYGESRYDSGAVYADHAAHPVYETLVIGESRIGMAAIGRDDSPYELILSVISDGSFPPRGKRGEELTPGQRRQLRDAMILEAHTRERRDVLVSNDRRAFVGRDGEKRCKLEALCTTRIRTVDEFCDEVAALAESSS